MTGKLRNNLQAGRKDLDSLVRTNSKIQSPIDCAELSTGPIGDSMDASCTSTTSFRPVISQSMTRSLASASPFPTFLQISTTSTRASSVDATTSTLDDQTASSTGSDSLDPTQQTPSSRSFPTSVDSNPLFSSQLSEADITMITLVAAILSISLFFVAVFLTLQCISVSVALYTNCNC
jgi:hypothetical protein